MSKVLFFGFLLVVFSCSSRHERMKGSVALKIDESKGIACLFGEEPQVGENLLLLRSVCKESGKGKHGVGSTCVVKESGKAKITKLLNDHYAEFETQGSASFEEGYLLELKR